MRQAWGGSEGYSASGVKVQMRDIIDEYLMARDGAGGAQIASVERAVLSPRIGENSAESRNRAIGVDTKRCRKGDRSLEISREEFVREREPNGEGVRRALQRRSRTSQWTFRKRQKCSLN